MVPFSPSHLPDESAAFILRGWRISKKFIHLGRRLGFKSELFEHFPESGAALGRDLKDLVLQARKGDAKAIRALVEATQGRLFKFCLVLTGDPVRAEDLAQEGYLKALAGLHQLKNPDVFMDWLFRVTKNVFIDDVRKRREELADSQTLEQASDEISGKKSDVNAALDVHRVLSQFEAEDRVLLVLVDMESYSYREAAEILGLTEDAVRSRLFRIRKVFVEKWGKS